MADSADLAIVIIGAGDAALLLAQGLKLVCISSYDRFKPDH